MPNYRQKNKKNKNKNRQKNQQQNQTQQQGKSKNQNPQENQQANQSRQETGKKDNQSQSRSQREQSNQLQPPKPLKSPTPTANLSPPLVIEGEANSTQLHASSQDARKVDSTAPTVAFVQCDNFNSNDSDAATAPTTNHQAIRAAVDREECNRVEDADADVYFSKLDNTEAAHSETVTRAGGVSGVIDSAMGNKESKTSIKGTKMATTADTVTASSDLRGMIRPDRSILGARELDTLQPMSKTQMAKVILHRIAREASEEEDKQKKNGDIDKVEQVANTADKLHRMVTEVPDGYNVDVKHEQEKQSTNIQTIVNGRQLEQQPADGADLARQSQQSNVIIHKIEKEEVEELPAEHLKAQPTFIVQNEGRRKVDAKKSQSSEGAKVIVHKIEREMGNQEATASVVVQQAIPDQKPTITEAITESASTTGMCNQLKDEGKVIIHHIQQYTESTSPINYQVELPDADSPTSQLGRSKQSILNKHIVQIQELSDESSSEYNDNPPLISEAESETESAAGACALDYAQSIRTLSPDSDDNYEVSCKLPATPSQEQQDLKQRRAQKRVALETHFLPQLLSPRYLDSIIEENSDMSDTRSDCSENPLMTTLSGDDLHDPSVAKVRKANEIFPRSNLDFSRRHAKKQLGALPKNPSPIREEPVAMVVAAKIIDATTPAQESCIRLSSEHTPESEAAEVIYLSSSASSSLSDLVELDAEAEGDDEREDSCRSMIDLDTDVREIITKPVSEEQVAITNILSDSRESTPVNQASTKLSENNETQKSIANNNRSVEQITAAPIGTNIDTNTANTTIINPIESRIFENLKSLQLLAEPSGERTLSSGGSATTIAYNRAATTTSESETETEMSSETITERCEYLRSSDTGGSSSSLNSSIEVKYPPATSATSDSLNVDPAVLLKNIELEMNSVRDILNSHTVEPNTMTTSCGNAIDTRSSELNFDHINSAKKASPSPPPIPPPPTSSSASDFHSDFTGSQIQPQPLSTAPPPIPTRAIHESTYVQTHTTEHKSPQTTNSLCSTNSALTSLSLLARQESAESHCSDSTQHSQCTAINVGSRPHTDNELTPPLTATSPISDEQQQRQYNDWRSTDGADNASKLTTNSDLKQSSDKKDASIKKLRLLCTETLASMPFGEEVLVELATVAQNIGELQGKPSTQTQEQNLVAQQKTDGTMPYPLPQLPHISELQLSIMDEQPHTSAPSSTLQRTTPSSATSTSTTHTVVIKQLSGPKDKERDLTTAKAMHSPSPPPVPAPPSHYIDAPWLGMPTSADPNVLVCLSPAQQQQLTSTSSQQPPVGVQKQTDQLLDAHRKFLERRGYHEFTEEQVKKINTELQQEEQQILKTAAYMKKLRKSLTPPPPPVPPPPVPSKSSETAAKAQSQVKTTSTISSIGSSITSSQRVYDATNYRNSNEQTTATFANGEEQHQQNQTNQSQPQRLLLLRQNNGEAADADAAAVSVAGSSSQQQASSLENNSRQSSAAAAAQGGAPASERKQPAINVDIRQYSNANASEPTNIRAFDSHGGNNYANSSFPSSSVEMQSVESELAKMFPSMGSSNIFDNNRKRFSNIESSTSAPGDTYCVQLQSTLPKRYSNIETRSYEAKKRIENGQVVYDYSNSQHERQSDGDKSLDSASTPSLLHFPVKEPSKETLQYPFAGDGTSSRSGNNEIMSAIKLNTTENAKTTTQETKAETNEKAKEINMTNFAYPGATTSTTNTSFASSSHFADHSFGAAADATKREDHIKNSQENGGSVGPSSSGGDGSGNAYEEFRQRAKATADAFGAFSETPATAPPLGESNKHSAFNFQHDKLFKDFDALSQQLNLELEEGKAHRQQREKSASLYDLSRTQWNFKDHFDQLKKQRHEHMQELEREIERSARSRQLKGWANGGNKGANNPPATGRTYDIPIHIEQRNGNNSVHSNDYAQATSDRNSMPREQTQQRSYHIPIVMENGAAPKVPPSPAEYDTVDDASRFRRAESMFNLSENTQRPQPQAQQSLNNYDRPQSAAADDWARYASDFGSSENITRPFAREVEICYQRQRPRTIRAPRLSASTNDLSSNSQYFDNYNAYNVRRSHAPMLQPVAQHQRPHHASCYSVLERDPNPTYISTTTRRGVSPAPVSPVVQSTAQEPLYSPHAPERQRRASLPREIQEQQLKYISSKEEELRMEFDRLQHERRRLMEELNNPPATLQMPQHPMRDIYRPAPKLPTLTEDEVFRQQMAEEWLSKVAEREERRLQKIIKISKVNETQQGHQTHEPPHPKTDISDEFLKRVQERRTKLAMPPDSDWESGAESQPVAPGHASESDAEVPPVKVIEGKSETDLRQLPRHLREFARFSNHNEEKIDGGHRVVHQEEERRQEANANSMSSALKKSSVVKTVKIARQPEIMGQPSQKLPASAQQQQQKQQGHSRTTSGCEQVFADETAPFSTAPPHARYFSKLPVSPSFDEMFATSPFRSRIYDEFERFWRSFDHTT